MVTVHKLLIRYGESYALEEIAGLTQVNYFVFYFAASESAQGLIHIERTAMATTLAVPVKTDVQQSLADGVMKSEARLTGAEQTSGLTVLDMIGHGCNTAGLPGGRGE